jgi:hypothetical protein
MAIRQRAVRLQVAVCKGGSILMFRESGFIQKHVTELRMENAPVDLGAQAYQPRRWSA